MNDSEDSMLVRLYRQRLKEKDTDSLLIELQEARNASAPLAIQALERELEVRGIRTDQPTDT